MSRVVTGVRAVHEALRSRRPVQAVYVAADARKALSELAGEASRRGIRVEERSPAELDALAEGHKHQGVVAITGEFVYADYDRLLADAPRLLLALDQVTDPHNFGAIVRSAVAFGADGILTLKKRAAPVTPVVVRASAGATEHARIAKVTNLARTLADLAKADYQVVGLDAEGDHDIGELPAAPFGRVLVVGAEGKGLRRLVRERCTHLARIPMAGPVASLNASVAAAIALYATASDRG
ncbi:MAG: 23S rRNA (guanosine(2251)-2'-O)-methyltransferase RlmB [Myxococcota bacterium]|nr:23S rRNA (guanosine(2251)-2'-O)-methyltransferase RlmB [Myxococcota bacterium]